MALEVATEIQELVPTNPEGTDPKSEGDNHIRMIKQCLQNSFPGMSAPWTTDQPIAAGDPVDPQDLVTLAFLSSSQLAPIGFPQLWLLPTIPAGYVGFNGQLLSRTTYPKLFALYGVLYGSTDSSNFRMPKVNGLFPRFMDGGAAVDPDAATRTARPDGVAGDNVGTTQADQNKTHTHELKSTSGTDQVVVGNTATGPTKHGPGAGFGTNQNNPAVTTSVDGGAEARPKNMYFNLICRAG